MFGFGGKEQQQNQQGGQQPPAQQGDIQQKVSVVEACDAAIRRMAAGVEGIFQKKPAPQGQTNQGPQNNQQASAQAQAPVTQQAPQNVAPQTEGGGGAGGGGVPTKTPSPSAVAAVKSGPDTSSGGAAPGPATQAAQASTPGDAKAPGPTDADVKRLEGDADTYEAQVMTLAKALATAQGDAAKEGQTALQAAYDKWRAAIILLIHDGAADCPEVKDFARKTEQAALVQANMPLGTEKLEGQAYHDAAMKTVQAVNVADSGATAQGVVDSNPLIGAPSVTHGPSLQNDKAKQAGTTDVTVGDKKDGFASGQARKDLFMVFCPGVVSTSGAFNAQAKQALEMGISSLVANTGTFIDPDVNAQAIAAACMQGKQQLGNPDAKIILVGYSQGNTNLYAFMRDKTGQFAGLRKDVIAIHDMHSAAGGSQMADLAFAIGDYLGTDKNPTPEQMKLLEALYRGVCDVSGIDKSKAKGIEGAMAALRSVLMGTRHAIRKVENTVSPVMTKLGLHGLSEEQLGKKLFKLFLDGQNLTDEFAAHGGEAGKIAAKLLDPLWKQVTSSSARDFLTEGPLNMFLHTYVDGGLRSLTTGYGQELLSDPQLQANLSGVTIINSIGAVPKSREDALVPKSQRLGYAFFNELGLDSDYQVATQNQKLEGKLPNAVDLPTEAVGHWGVAGVIVPGDHPATYFSDFSPPGLTKAALVTLNEMGVI